MIDLNELESTIALLENGETTFASCEKLAALYTCRDHLMNGVDKAESELSDILPYYIKYKDIKKRYQHNQAIDSEVIQGIIDVCHELQEFIDVLYYSTDMNKERSCIKTLIQTLYEKYKE